MEEKTFSCRRPGANYFGFARLTLATPAQPGTFFCEVLNTSSLSYFTLQRTFSHLELAEYQHRFNILGHNRNGYTLAGNHLRIDDPATPGVLIIVTTQNFASADERLTILGKLMQKEVDYLWQRTTLSGQTNIFVPDANEQPNNFTAHITFPPGSFSEPPIVVCSLGGNRYHWNALGGSHPYEVTEHGFYVWIEAGDPGINAQNAHTRYGWHVNWIATKRT